MSLDCACQRASTLVDPGEYQGYSEYLKDLLAGFSEIRNACPALKSVLIPEKVWPAFQEWSRKPPDQAHMRPILFLAYKRATLHRLTIPIHRFVLDGSELHEKITNQYRKDLREQWMMAEDCLKRHRQSKSFFGRLAELQTASWLESEKGWEIKNLEMWGGDFDFTASSTGGERASIEVKYLGTSEEAFESGRSSLQGGVGLYSLRPNDAANFLLLRACEAARQLERSTDLRIVILIVSDSTWDDSFGFPLENTWIDWQEPNFFQGTGSWEDFLLKNKISAAQLNSYIARLATIQQIWVLRQKDDFQLEVFSQYLLGRSV